MLSPLSVVSWNELYSRKDIHACLWRAWDDELTHAVAPYDPKPS